MRLHFFLFPLILLSACRPGPTPADTAEQNLFVRAFLDIPAEAQTVRIGNQLEVNDEGGHLQGVQLIDFGEQAYAVLSGSSSTYAYLATARLDEKGQVIGVHRLLEKPFKHAGGFQIHDGLLAVGIEDNEARDRSKVFVYRLDDPEAAPTAPLAVIERQGDYERATAGAVGLTKEGNRLLVVVGNWGSRDLDFYTAAYPPPDSQALSFAQVYTIDTKTVDKSDWSDPDWLSYQNINLFLDKDEKLYLIGMTSDSQDQDAADLYELLIDQNDRPFQLRKLATRRFPGREQTKFRWGSGIYRTPDGQLRIVACGEHLGRESPLTIY